MPVWIRYKIYTLLHAFERIVEALLPLWLRQNMHSEHINRIFRCRKTLTTDFIFYIREQKKKSFGAKSGLYGGWLIKSIFWVVKNAVAWADVEDLGRQLANKCWCTYIHTLQPFSQNYWPSFSHRLCCVC